MKAMWQEKHGLKSTNLTSVTANHSGQAILTVNFSFLFNM
jgi:hypothetical protein